MPVKRYVAAVALGLVIALYLTGRLDYTLYPLGLNFHQCARNGIGATFCGPDLTAYENHLRGVQRQIQQAQQSLTQQEQATQQQAQQQAQQAQQTLTQQECQADPSLSFCAPP
jgi:hypothetical protein